MIAQAVVESGWGSSALSQAPYYNLFGIKGSYQGQTVYMDTLEFLNNQWVNKKSLSDNILLLLNLSMTMPMYLEILHLATVITMPVLGRATRNPIQMRQLV